MQTLTFPDAAAVTNAMSTLPGADRMRCITRQTEAGYEIDAPDDLADALRADHPVAPLPAQAVITYKADIYRRCTDAEAEAIELALTAAPVRERRLFESAQFLDHAAPEFASMHEHMVGMFGADRAAVLLAAS